MDVSHGSKGGVVPSDSIQTARALLTDQLVAVPYHTFDESRADDRRSAGGLIVPSARQHAAAERIVPVLLPGATGIGPFLHHHESVIGGIVGVAGRLHVMSVLIT